MMWVDETVAAMMLCLYLCLRLEIRRELLILFGQLHEHEIIEEFVDGHILTQPLSTSCLDHKFTRQCIHRCGFERT